MRVCESPNIPFTILYERFQTGDNIVLACLDIWIIITVINLLQLREQSSTTMHAICTHIA